MTLVTPPDRARGPAACGGSRRGGLRHRARALPRHGPRPRERRASTSWRRPRAAWRSRRSRPSTPEKILREAIDPAGRPRAPSRRRKLAFGLGLTGDAVGKVVALLHGALPRLRRDRRLAGRDQPAGRHRGRRASLALDAKMNFDDNALFRHPDLAATARPRRGGPARGRGQGVDLTYIALDGNIGCMVNGAGLAMATMDIIKLRGRRAGQLPRRRRRRHEEKVTAAFKHHPRRPEREGDPRQHLRRHHEVRRDRRGRRRGGEGGAASRSRWWSGWRAPTSSRARRSSPRVGLDDHPRRRPAARRREKAVAAAARR